MTRRKLLLTLLPVPVLVALCVLPAANPGPNLLKLVFITCVWTTTSVAWNLLGGFAGQVSFGFAVFFGLGAYTCALLSNAGHGAIFTLLCSAAISVLASFLVGLPTFRLRGPYFAIATIGVGEAVRVVMNNLDLTGGASGYRLLENGPFRQLEHYYSGLVLVTAAVLVSLLISRSRFGLALSAIRQDEEAAADLGINPYFSKLWIHAVGAALAGVAGAVYARRALFIYPGDVFSFQTSISILLMPVIGGVGTVWGPVLGGLVFGVVQEELVAKFQDIHLLLYGTLLILIILFEPDGILGLLRRAFRSRRESPGSQDTDKVLWGRRRLEGREL